MLIVPRIRVRTSSTPLGVFGVLPPLELREMLTFQTRDTLEQIDVSHLLIKQYSEVCLSLSNLVLRRPKVPHRPSNSP